MICNTGSLYAFLFADMKEAKHDLINLFRNNFLTTIFDQEKKVYEGLQLLQQKYKLHNMTRNDCFVQMSNQSITRQRKSFLLSLATTLTMPKQGILPLGTALRMMGRDSFEFISIELEQLNLEIQEYFQRALELTFSLKNRSLEDEMLFRFKSIMTSEKDKAFFYSIAQMFAEKRGLTEYLLPIDSPSMPPILSSCFLEGTLVSHCFDPSLTYSEQGMGISMNLGDWDELFKMEIPKRNLLHDKGSKRINNGDIMLHIHNFGYLANLPYK